jgi:hypothetical protein
MRIGTTCAQKTTPHPLRTLHDSAARPCNQYHAAASIFALPTTARGAFMNDAG